MSAKRFDNIMVNTKTIAAQAKPEGIKITFAPAKDGVAVTERGFINVDIHCVS